MTFPACLLSSASSRSGGAVLAQEIEKFISPLQLARALGLGESTIKRWIDHGRIPALKTAGGHRRIPVAAAVAFVREGGFELADPAALGLALAAEATPETLVELLTSEQPDRVIALFERLYTTGTAAHAIADEWLAPAMHAVGHGWESGDVAVTSEHRATGTAARALHALLRTHPPGHDRPLALVAALSGDPYLLPCLCAELVLCEAGYRVVNFGPDTPLESLREAVAQSEPLVVALSFSTSPPGLGSARLRAAFRDTVESTRSAVLVGGRTADDGVVEAVGATSWCRSMRDLDRLARHLHRDDGDRAALGRAG